MARLAKEERTFIKYENVIADRMIIDSHAYTTYQSECVWVRSDQDHYLLEVSRDLALLSAAKYDSLFFFPPYWAPTADKVRATEVSYQLSISDLIEEFLFKNEIEYKIVPEVSAEERLEWIKKEVY
jgi:hypothetical protein